MRGEVEMKLRGDEEWKMEMEGRYVDFLRGRWWGKGRPRAPQEGVRKGPKSAARSPKSRSRGPKLPPRPPKETPKASAKMIEIAKADWDCKMMIAEED